MHIRAAAALAAALATAADGQRSCKAPAPPAPAPPPRPGGHDPEYYSNHLPLAPGIVLHATLHPVLLAVELLLQVTVPEGEAVGWLGLGVSPTGNMTAGSFMVGWGSPTMTKGCVEASSLPVGAHEGAPTGPAGFTMVDKAYAVADGYAWLQLARPLHDSLPGHASIGTSGTLRLMVAAGSKAPSSCGRLNH
jgi:hypothetical protein